MPCRAGTPSDSIKQWVDVPQGDTPYAEKLIEDKDLARYETWDVSVLVTNWLLGKYPNYGFLLRTLPGKGGTIVFFSREADALETRAVR